MLSLFIKISIKIIKESIEYGGVSFDRAYFHPDGELGNYQKKLKVYLKEGDNCKKCKSKIKKVYIKKRSSFYCPKCQKM